MSPATAEMALVAMINADRAAVGLPGLRLDARLSAVAHERSASMAAAGQLSHVQSDGRTVVDLITANGISWYAVGETIGWNDYPKLGDSTRVVNQGWMTSAEHTAIIRSTAYNYFGLGLGITATGDRYWTAIFLRGPDRTPPWATMQAPATGSLITLASLGRARQVTWSWAGDDRPLAALTAGLRSFDVQRRVDSGAWVFIRTSTTTRSWSSSVAVGHRIAIRVRARDRAGNVGTWSSPVGVSA
ncbi:MAG TPA: CAP domain-containing protein [Candidatus Limnocylindrales bacterium]